MTTKTQLPSNGTIGTVQARLLRREERPLATAAIEQWSGYTGPHLLPGHYPQVFSPEADAELCGAFDGDALVGHAAFRRVKLWTAAGPQRAWFIGSVITAPPLRRRGIGSQLMQALLAIAEQERQDALYLWSDKWAFYQRFGFEPSGKLLEIVLRTRHGILAPGIRPARACDVIGMLELHRTKVLRVERSLHDMALMLGTAEMLTMVLERRGKIAAYGCYGKGMDFRGWWHEFGGSDEDAATLVMASMEVLGQDRAFALLPPYRESMLERMRPCIVECNHGVGALRRALTPLGNADFFVDGMDGI